MPVIKISDDSFQAVPVFPLSGLSLFPHMNLPLHIFEPRYVAMLQYALEHDKLIAIADVEPQADNPTLPPVLGAGVVLKVKELPGSRFNVLMHGITRLKLIEERPQIHSFRQAHAEILMNEQDPEEELLERDLLARDLITQLAELHPPEREALIERLDHCPTPELLSEVASARLLRDLLRRREAFGTLSPARRLDVLNEGLGELLLSVAGVVGEAH